MCVNNFVFCIFAAGLMSGSGQPVPLKYLVMQSFKGDVQYRVLQPHRSAGHVWSVCGVACSLCPSGLMPFDWHVCLWLCLYMFVCLSVECMCAYSGLHLLE